MLRLLSILLFLPAGLLAVAQSQTHEEEVVRATYGALTFACSLQPVMQAAIHELGGNSTNARALNKDVDDATPIFEISHFKTGTLASIASQQWNTLMSVPTEGQVLEGHTQTDGYTDETSKAQWKEAIVKWGIDPSYTPEVMAEINRPTVSEALKLSDAWQGPATYTRYATFEVTLTFQGKTVGPYTATFFFGKNSAGREVVSPQDRIGAGQMLWEIRRPIYTRRKS